jgi:glycine/D-amino acid oxidase-like deaminating enzyme
MVESFMDTKVLKIEIGTETADIFSADKKFEGFDHVVLAAGAHVETILEGSGYGTKKNRRISGSTLQVSKNTSQDFAVIAGKHSIVSFFDKISIGATSLNLSQSHNEGKEKQDLENLLGEFDEYLPNLSLNVQNYRIRSGVRLCYENMVPRIEWLNCSKNTRCVFVVSGLYKNGYQFSPLAFQIMNQS